MLRNICVTEYLYITIYLCCIVNLCLFQTIKEEKMKGAEEPKPLRFLQKIEKPIPRPPTPTVEVPSDEEEERELAVIFLQQVIRGRAIQNMVSTTHSLILPISSMVSGMFCL